MPVSRRISAVFFSACVFSASSLFAQPSFSSIGSISSPAMPSISTPSMSGGFYVPSGMNYKFYTGINETRKTEVTESKKNDENSKKEKKNSLVSTLTAKELTALGGMGLLKNFSGSINSLGTSLYGTGNESSEETRVILEKVLFELEEIKKNTKEFPVEKPVTIVASAPVISSSSLSSAAEKASSRILRFSVNDYDILKTCGKIYISDIQHDGSFLVTGDRRYQSDGKQRKETFHMLFKNSMGENSATRYTAAASVTQDYLNEFSFLYQLSKRKDMSAMRTGNLVIMRTDDPEWKLELLIDLGEKQD